MTDTPGTAPAPGPDPSTRPVPGPVTVCPWEGMTGALEARLTAAATVAAAADEDPAARPARRVVLVGPMGAGKTTVGRALAAVTGLPFVDSDELFTQVHGPIPEFFAEHGEAAFRAEEARVIGHVLGRPTPCVLSCGGGAVLHPGTRRALAGPDSDVVYLAVGEEEALRRVGGGAGRPVLAGDPAGTWRRILAEREGLYREVADLVLDTTGLTAPEAAWRIVGDAHRPRRSESHP